jgi:predicted P-loop ATPase
MVSIFKHAKDPKSERNLSVDSFFDGVKNGQWQDQILDFRTGKIEKTALNAVTASGVFKERKSNLLIKHSGMICIDIDAKDQICDFDIEQIKEDDFVYCVHRSCSGNGFAVYVKIDPERHLDAFLGLEEYFFVNYSIVVDKSCKDISRLRFVSYDPELHLNEKAKVFKKYLKKKEVERKNHKQIVIKSDFDEMVKNASSMNLFDDYSDYIKLAFALASEFGANGEMYFHALCQSSSKYDEVKASKHYQKACSRDETGVSIATVYWKFKDAGISLTSEKTEAIKSAIKLSENPKETLKELGIEDDENLIDKLKPSVKEKTELDEIVDLIKMQKIRFNEITRNFEIKAIELTDRHLAEFYSLVWHKIDDGISKDKIWTLIQSKQNTPSFNPIHDFYLKNQNLIPENEFEKLKSCFEIEAKIHHNDEFKDVDDYLDIYLKKWLLGIVGSSFGTYSLMILVLVGEQGIKKTEFFRNLLPKELRKYYAESNLDEGKDSEILMCKKLLIVDDEFGGKSKKDATKLKRLSSQQTFSIRAPYGRITEDLNRLAVLGGTSNDSEVINDPTGNRRIIPVNLKSFDLEKFKKIDKNKLFIELYNEWKIDPNGWFMTKEEVHFLNEMTLKNTEVWQEEDLISRYLKPDLYNFLTSTDIKLLLEKHFPSLRTNTKRIGQSLKKLAFDQEMRKINGKIMRVYRVQVDL